MFYNRGESVLGFDQEEDLEEGWRVLRLHIGASGVRITSWTARAEDGDETGALPSRERRGAANGKELDAATRDLTARSSRGERGWLDWMTRTSGTESGKAKARQQTTTFLSDDIHERRAEPLRLLFWRWDDS